MQSEPYIFVMQQPLARDKAGQPLIIASIAAPLRLPSCVSSLYSCISQTPFLYILTMAASDDLAESQMDKKTLAPVQDNATRFTVAPLYKRIVQIAMFLTVFWVSNNVGYEGLDQRTHDGIAQLTAILDQFEELNTICNYCCRQTQYY